MSRLLAVLLAALLATPLAARAQETRAAPDKAPDKKDDAAGVDPAIQAAIQKALEKAKDDIRNEVRAEIQGAQSAAEFMGTVAEGPKLQFFQVEGYLRLRGDVLDNLYLGRPEDSAGARLFPVPLQGSGRGTLSSANMRLRLEPTLNVSEHVRVKAQVDILDNYVLGSNTGKVFDDPRSPYPVPFYGSSRELSANDPTRSRDAILPKRAWAEVQTPVGLLSFGRMPSAWGLGILTHAGQGLDADFGDTVDRIQFALPPVETPAGKLTIVPILDFDSEGVLNADPRFGAASGQPFDAESGDDARTYALKVARLDTEDEIRRLKEAGNASFNYGAYYNYRTQRWTYPAWATDGFGGTYTDASNAVRVKRGAYAHVFDFWARWLSPRWRVEAEGVGVIGQVANAFSVDANTGATTDLGRVLLRQWGAVLQAEYEAIPARFWLGGELGLASGDPAPGFGNIPNRLDQGGELPAFGAVEGPQFGQPGDNAIRNFRFNPAYRVDTLLWRRILGQVTDAWYLKPSLRWDFLPGLRLDAAAIYSQAMDGGSTPSAVPVDAATASGKYRLAKGGKKPLGLELDSKVTLDAGDGFVLWGETAVLQPFGGLGPGATKRGWALSFGLAAKF